MIEYLCTVCFSSLKATNLWKQLKIFFLLAQSRVLPSKFTMKQPAFVWKQLLELLTTQQQMNEYWKGKCFN
jgi:hypothetical protein